MKLNLIIASILLIALSVGGAMAIPPNPTDLTNETGNGWVQFDWNAGVGTTDSYNISRTVDGITTYYNGTTNDYIKWTGMSGDTVTIVVYAFEESTSTLSAGSITDTVEVPMLFSTIVNLLDAIIPLFTSLLNLIVAIFPLVIGMAFLVGLALLINKIFSGALGFSFKGKR